MLGTIWIDRALGALTSVLNMAGTIFIFFLLAIVNLDIAGRFLFNSPLVGAVEMVVVSTTVIVYFQIAHALREGRIARVDTVLNLVCAKFPRFGSAVNGLYNLVGAATFFMIVYYTYPFFERSLASGDVYGNPLVFGVPKWPVRLVMLVGCGAVVLQFLVLALKDFASTIKPKGRNP